MRSSRATDGAGRRSQRARRLRGLTALTLAGLVASACFERGERWYLDEPSGCIPAARRCVGDQLEHCVKVGGNSAWELEHDCAADSELCSPSLLACANCNPGARQCSGQTPEVCGLDGAGFEAKKACDAKAGEACRAGNCVNLCSEAHTQRSNVGCEY